MDFIDRADEDRCIKYMIKIIRAKKTSSRKWTSKDNQKLAIEEALHILEHRKKINSETYLCLSIIMSNGSIFRWHGEYKTSTLQDLGR